MPYDETDRALRESVFRAFEMEKPELFDEIRKSYALRESQRSTLFEKKYYQKGHASLTCPGPVNLWSNANFHSPSMFRSTAVVISVRLSLGM